MDKGLVDNDLLKCSVLKHYRDYLKEVSRTEKYLMRNYFAVCGIGEVDTFLQKYTNNGLNPYEVDKFLESLEKCLSDPVKKRYILDFYHYVLVR